MSTTGLHILLESVQSVDCACLKRCTLIIICVLFDYGTTRIGDYVMQHDMTIIYP